MLWLPAWGRRLVEHVKVLPAAAGHCVRAPLLLLHATPSSGVPRPLSLPRPPVNPSSFALLLFLLCVPPSITWPTQHATLCCAALRVVLGHDAAGVGGPLVAVRLLLGVLVREADLALPHAVLTLLALLLLSLLLGLARTTGGGGAARSEMELGFV